MITASRLAGFCAAHAVWSLSQSTTFIPILAYTDANDDRHMERIVGDDIMKTVAAGRDKLATNGVDANDAVLLYDAAITQDDKDVPAIIIEMRAYFAPDAQAILAVPYTPQDSGSFRIHQSMLLAWKDCEDFDKGAAQQAFLEGVAEHESGAQIWHQDADEA